MTQSGAVNEQALSGQGPAMFNMDRHMLQEQHRRLSDLLRSKLLRSFEDIDDELARFNAELDAKSITSDAPEFQEGEHKAESLALHGDQLRSAQCDAAALAVAMLYHQWERSAKWLIARKNYPAVVSGLAGADFTKLKSLLKHDELDAECRVIVEQIDLGRLIANVVKHGTGSSADNLRGRAPRLFDRPWRDEHFALPSDMGVDLIWVLPANVESLAAAIETFWQILPDDRFPPARPPSLEAFLNGTD